MSGISEKISEGNVSAQKSASKWVSIGRVGRPHGVKGGIRVFLHNEESDLLNSELQLRLLPAEASADEADGKKATDVRIDKIYGENLITFVGVHGRENVAKYTGRTLYALRGEFPELSDDETYLVDLIGAEVRDAASNELFGVIESFGDNGAQPLARVRNDKMVVEMPFAPGLVVDVSDNSQLVLVDAPIGLFVGDADEAKAPSEESKVKRERARAKRRKKELKRKAAKEAKVLADVELEQGGEQEDSEQKDEKENESDA